MSEPKPTPDDITLATSFLDSLRDSGVCCDRLDSLRDSGVCCDRRELDAVVAFAARVRANEREGCIRDIEALAEDARDDGDGLDNDLSIALDDAADALRARGASRVTPDCTCGVAKGLRSDHEAECKGAYLQIQPAVKSTPKLPRGWGCSPASRKAHYFRESDTRSLCGKIGFFTGAREDFDHASPDNCAECRKRREKTP